MKQKHTLTNKLPSTQIDYESMKCAWFIKLCTLSTTYSMLTNKIIGLTFYYRNIAYLQSKIVLAGVFAINPTIFSCVHKLL